jgi:ABC-type Mn2+/Zn2+ transport system permease subunit
VAWRLGQVPIPAHCRALLVTRSIRATFALSATLGIALTCLGLAASFYLDLPPGPTAVALLALSVPAAAVSGRHRV